MTREVTISLLSLLGFSCTTGNKETADKPLNQPTAQETPTRTDSPRPAELAYYK